MPSPLRSDARGNHRADGVTVRIVAVLSRQHYITTSASLLAPAPQNVDLLTAWRSRCEGVCSARADA